MSAMPGDASNEQRIKKHRGKNCLEIVFLPKIYISGFDIGAIMPCLSKILGFVAACKVSFVAHSGPTGIRRDLSYCWRFSKVWGKLVARYLLF